MGGEWKSLRLSEITLKITKGTTPTKSDGGFVDCGVNFIKAEAVTLEGTIDTTKFAYVSSDVYEKYRRSQLNENDILFSMAGVVLGKSALVKKKHLPANTNQALALIRPDKKKIFPQYLHYYLRQPSVFHYVNNSTSQSAQPNINLAEIGHLDINFPSYAKQKSIAHILGTLDDKIELNRQMNATLEAMAQALFKSWFVDFDPVIDNALAAGNPIPEPLHAKAEVRAALGDKRKPLPEAIQKQFPSSFVFSEEMGWIPEGWLVTTLGDVCHKITDGAHASPKSVESGFPMASVKDMHDWGIDLSGCRKIAEEDYVQLVKNNCKPQKNDVLIAKDGSYLKHIFVVEKELEMVLLSSIAILRPNERVNPHFLSFTLKRRDVLERMKNYVSGAVLQRIILKDFRRFEIVLPPVQLQKEWFTIVGTAIEKCWANIHENESLSKIRDTFLPKLLSGQLRIPDAEKLVKDAV